LQEISGFKLPPLPPATWTRDVLSGDVCSQSEATLIICGAWSLWTGRNARNHDKRSMNAGVAARHVARMVEDVICLKYDNCWKYALEPTGFDPLVDSDGFDPLWCKSPNGPQML
jgi:hypothetical protein